MKLMSNYFSCNDATIGLIHFEKRKKEYLLAFISESLEEKDKVETFIKEFALDFNRKNFEDNILNSNTLSWGVIIIDAKFKIFGNTNGECYTCNYRFNKPCLKKLHFFEEGKLEKGASILICNQSYHSHVTNQEVANALSMKTPSENRIGLHLKELGEENIRRSKINKGAGIYIVLQTD